MTNSYPMIKENKPEENTWENLYNQNTEEPKPKPIDTSDPKVKEVMQDEYRTWKTTPRNDPNREVLEKAWYQKYYGYSDEEFEKNRVRSMNSSPAEAIERLGETFQNLSIPGLSLADFGMDVVGSLPGLARLDDWYDESTKFDDPIKQKFRRFLSVALPSMISTKAAADKVAGMQLPALWQKRLVGTGLFTAQEAAVIGLSDLGEEHNIGRMLSDT